MVFNKKIFTNISKEMEETILNDENQLKELYNKIEYLEKSLNNKDITIKNLNEEILLLKNKNKCLKEIIEKNSFSYTDINDNSINKRKSIYYDTAEIIDRNINTYKEYVNKENIINEGNNLKTDENFEFTFHSPNVENKRSINNETDKKIINFNNNKYKRFMLLSFLYTNKNKVKNILNDYRKKQTKKVNRKMAKLPNIRDKTVFIGERVPIKVLKNINNNLVFKTIAAETSLRIKLAHEISELTKRDTNIINYKEIIDYIISQSDCLDGKAITRLRRKYQRSWDIYDIYGEKLNILKFSISAFSEMDDEDYKKWKLYLADIINELPKQCNYIFRKGDNKGNICNEIDCIQHNCKKQINNEN